MTQWIISSSILIFVMVLLRQLLRKRIKPAVQYALWGLVLLRLLIPVQFGSAEISLQNAVEKAPVIHQMELADQVQYFVYHADGTATGYYEFQPSFDHSDTPAVAEPVPEVFTIQQAETIKQIRSVKDVLTQVWLWGMAVVGLTFALSNLRFARGLRNRKRIETDGVLPVYVTENVETPCLFGLFRPAIYLPPSVAADESHLRYSLAHETTHYRHGDALWSVLRCLCIVVHWYNPLVWWAAILSREDGEIACDEATIKKLGESHRADYGRVLVDLTCRKRTDLLQTATTMTGSAKGLKKRIEMIVKRPKMALYILIIMLLVVSIAVGCTFTGGSKPTEDSPTTETTGETTETTNSTETTQKETEEKLPESIVGTALTEHELKQFTAMFTRIPEGQNWYNILLACNFSRPEEINVRDLFGNGFRPLVELTDDDIAFLMTTPDYIPNAGDMYKLPVPRMEEVLNIYLGVSLQTINKTYLDRMDYYADGNCYFTGGGGAIGEIDFEMIDGKREDDGTVWLLCRKRIKDFGTYRTDWLRLLCLKPQTGYDTTPYRVQSCKWLIDFGKPYEDSVNIDG